MGETEGEDKADRCIESNYSRGRNKDITQMSACIAPAYAHILSLFCHMPRHPTNRHAGARIMDTWTTEMWKHGSGHGLTHQRERTALSTRGTSPAWKACPTAIPGHEQHEQHQHQRQESRRAVPRR